MMIQGPRHGKKIRTHGYSTESVLILTGNTRVDQVWVRVRV